MIGPKTGRSSKYLHSLKPLWKSPLRVQAQTATPARHLLSMDGINRREKNHEDRQQGSGPGMPAAYPQLPPTSWEHRDTSTEGSRQRALDIPLHAASNQTEAGMNQQADLVGN
jgi:hypothetical protein